MFKTNEGTIDRAIRIIVGAALIIWYFMAPADAGYRIWLWIGVIPLVTGLIGSCPLYSVFGINTCPMKKD